MTLGGIGLVSVLLIVGFVLVRIIDKAILKRLSARHTSPDLIHLVRRVFLVFVACIAFFTVLELLNVPLSTFAFISGAVAIGIGFGAQNIINNFISGWILLWERPIRIGDFLEINDVRGTVEAINTRSTRIKREDGVHMLIPNSHLLENMVVNWTLIDPLIRSQVKVGVAYGSPVRKVEELLYQAVADTNDALDTPEPQVVFESFGDSTLDFEILFWSLAGGEKALRLIRSELRFRIDELFREHGIVIAFPQRDIHLDNAAPLAVQVVNRGAD